MSLRGRHCGRPRAVMGKLPSQRNEIACKSPIAKKNWVERNSY
jgi:hypothetical protein